MYCAGFWFEFIKIVESSLEFQKGPWMLIIQFEKLVKLILMTDIAQSFFLI